MTQQYFGQIEKGLQDAIFTNVSNYYVFRVSEEDARALEGNLTIELPKETLLEGKALGNKEQEIRVRILTSLNSRECLLRLSKDGQILPCVKAKTADFIPAVSNTSPVELKPVEDLDLPSKFQDKIEQQNTFYAPKKAMDEMRNDAHLDGQDISESLSYVHEQIEKYNNDPAKVSATRSPIPVPQESYMMDNNFTNTDVNTGVSPEISNIEQPLRSANVPSSSIENLNIKTMNLAELNSIGPDSLPQHIGPSIDVIHAPTTENLPAMTLEQFLASQSTNKISIERNN